MPNVLLLLGTALAIFFSFALFAGMVVGAVHSFFFLILLCAGKDVQATVETRKRKSIGSSRRTRRAEYHLTVSYSIGSQRCTKKLISKNWNAFHDVPVGSTVPVRVWCPGWAALSADLPDWKEWKLLAVLMTIVAVVYAWFLRKVAFQVLPGLLVPYGISEEVSQYYIMGACLLILPAYIATTLYTLTRMEDTEPVDQLPTDLEVTLTPTGQREFSPIHTSNSFFSSVMRSLKSESYERPTALELREMLPQRRAPHEFV